MNNKLAIILGGALIVALVFLGVLYKRQADLGSRIDQLNTAVRGATTLEGLQTVINDFLVTNKQQTISLFKSNASGTGTITLSKIEPASATSGTHITISGSGINLPSYVVFGPGVITDPVTSQNPDTISFDVPSKVLQPVCPQFPTSICSQLGLNSQTSASEIAINKGTYTIYVANQQGEISNAMSFEVK